MNSKIAPNITEYLRTRIKTADECFAYRIDKCLRTQAVRLRNAEKTIRHMKWFMSGDRYKNILKRNKEKQ